MLMTTKMKTNYVRTTVTAVVIFWSMLCSPANAQLNLKPFTKPFNIHEDTIVETQLLPKVDCTNPGDACLCNVKDSNPPNPPFVVWKKNGFSDFYIYYKGRASGGKLSFKTNPTYFVTITCRDTAGNTVETVAEIDIQQNQAPQITNANYPDETLTLDAKLPYPENTDVYQVTATDAENDPLFYSITTNPKVDYFAIGARDGMIKTLVDLRTATEDDIVITVTVTDGYNVVNNFEIVTTITDLNTRPQILNLPKTVYIPETTASGTTILTLTLQDPDPFVSQLEPTCTVEPNGEQYKFTYEAGTRRIRLSTLVNAPMPLDYESVNKYLITCVLSDGFLESQNDVLTLYIENVNEPPVFDEVAYYCDLYESSAGVSRCDLDAFIYDPEGDVITSIGFLNGNNSNRFRYDRSDSYVTFNVDYDVDQNLMPTNLVLQLQATDSQGATSRAPVYITVSDVNDNTCDFGPTSLNTFSADQGTSLGSLGNFIATDDDLTSPNNELTYEVIRALPADSTNYIAAYPGGELAYIGLIPEENHGKSYSLVVRCKDGGSPRRTSEGTIVLTYQTTTTTSTTTTTTPTTTTTTTTTTQAPDESIWDNDGFVAIFAILMSLLILGLLVGLYFLLRACGLFSGLGALGSLGSAAPAAAAIEGVPGAATSAARPGNPLCGPDNGCNNFCCPKPKVEPVEEYFNPVIRTNNEYRDTYWKTGDHFESGMDYDSKGVKFGNNLEGGHRVLALPAPSPRGINY